MGMINCNCNVRCGCVLWAVIAAAVIGVLTAFFQITGVILLTTAFLWVVFGIAVVYLGVLTGAGVIAARTESCVCRCRCDTIGAVLVGILGTILFSVILIAAGITATSVISAILVGLLVFSLVLMIVSTACLIRTLTNCDRE